ncbi:GDSL-type esterase/lipase family protein [Streptomyces sp. SPB162]|uniref:GDSL-type esterase/lipase family protein n=1 Tax=Streptomyces sp. SPB162 TaxID=2940560 RepID=UPI002405F8DE|nr:GDSL-type esterase/lipase family protein [Streptomyces sp. SPB162]MDF9816648.1 lysophospholipase L1-like esterase [Streptomyces sp. SPB162]
MRPWLRRIPTLLGYAAAVLAVAALSVWLSVRVTPLQTVSPAGQTVQVGAATPDLNMSGPGELELFGQTIPTQPRFEGPIRPRLKLTHISLNAQASALTKPGGAQAAGKDLSEQLTSAWTRYLLWETLIAIGFAALIAVAVAGIRRSSRASMLWMLAIAVTSVFALNALGVYLLASATPAALRQVRGIEDLVGPSTPTPVQAVGTPAQPGVEAVVIGDSTAAAIGNAPLDHPTTTDTACGRSKDAYALYLAAANNWNILNLACSSATIRDGLLGPQQRGTTQVPPQLSAAMGAGKASVIIVSIGANDIHWSTMAALCAAANACDDRASTAYFQQQIAAFTTAYYDLLSNVAALPQHPRVLINEYYNPFGENIDCLKDQNITTAKAKILKSRLDQLNSVLRQGAQTFDFTAVPQHFDGHRLCSDQPFVQGPDADAPLHPNAAGELAIALADQQALSRTRTPTSTPTPSTGAAAQNTP